MRAGHAEGVLVRQRAAAVMGLEEDSELLIENIEGSGCSARVLPYIILWIFNYHTFKIIECVNQALQKSHCLC